MELMNSRHQFGLIARTFHWSIFLLFVAQVAGGTMMSRIGRDETVLGAAQSFWYEWHKTLGLTIVIVAVLRLAWRLSTPMPDWAEVLTENERRLSHWLEICLYMLMFSLPITGFLYVMAGGYGIKAFNRWPLPNPIGKIPELSTLAHIAHLAVVWLAVIVIAWHAGAMLKKHFVDHKFLLRRML